MEIDFYKIFEEMGIEIPALNKNYNKDNYAQEIYGLNQGLSDISYASSSQIITKQKSCADTLS